MPTPPPSLGKAHLLHGVCLEARAALYTGLCGHSSTELTVALIANPRRAQSTAAEIEIFAGWMGGADAIAVHHFPEEPLPDIDANRRADRICERLAVLSALLRPAPTKQILIATPEALLGACPLRSEFESQQIKLRVGDEVPFTSLVQRLTEALNYDAEALCEHPGQVATRGGLIDVYPYDANEPYRIDFFGDEIESIRSFDPASQRTARATESISIAAAISNEATTTSREGNLIDYLPDTSIQWLFEDPALLVREHPLRFEKANKRSIYPVLARRAPCTDQHLGICEVDTDPELFKEAARSGISTEATENYRLHADASQVGIDRFESEQSTRSKFEAQLADWAKDNLQLCFATQNASETERIKDLLADNPLTTKLTPRLKAA